MREGDRRGTWAAPVVRAHCAYVNAIEWAHNAADVGASVQMVGPGVRTGAGSKSKVVKAAL